jgi:hypothetical protein
MEDQNTILTILYDRSRYSTGLAVLRLLQFAEQLSPGDQVSWKLQAHKVKLTHLFRATLGAASRVLEWICRRLFYTNQQDEMGIVELRNGGTEIIL